jgi:hypothetical protein
MVHAALPNLVIGGVGKAGTTSLFWYLGQHPDICPSSLKEIGYFAPLRFGLEDLPPLEQYAAHFAHAGGERYRLEASPGYLYGGAPLISALRSVLVSPKIIMILRDPAARVWPSYRYLRSRLQLDDSMSFAEYVQRCVQLRDEGRDQLPENAIYWTVSAGFYGDYVAGWLEAFGQDIRIVFFEDLARDPAGVVRELLTWMGLDGDDASRLDYTIQNKTVEHRHAWLQRLAVQLNTTPFWRRHQRLKQPFRTAYYAVNGRRTTTEVPDKATIDELERLYADANLALGRCLREHGYDRLPPWLVARQPDAAEEPA